MSMVPRGCMARLLFRPRSNFRASNSNRVLEMYDCPSRSKVQKSIRAHRLDGMHEACFLDCLLPPRCLFGFYVLQQSSLHSKFRPHFLLIQDFRYLLAYISFIRLNSLLIAYHLRCLITCLFRSVGRVLAPYFHL